MWYSVMNEGRAESVERCLEILEESAKILADLRDEQNEITPDMKLHDLYDMTEDLSESARLRRAESNLAKRQF